MSVRNWLQMSSICAALTLLSGCALLNPYESEFSCPSGADERGRCISVQDAYAYDRGEKVLPPTQGEKKKMITILQEDKEALSWALKADGLSEDKTVKIETQITSIDKRIDQIKNTPDNKMIPSAPKMRVEVESEGVCTVGDLKCLAAAQTEPPAPVSYRAALYNRLEGLVKEPVTPIVAPPKVMRVLMLPYRGAENEFYMMRYAYFFVDGPRWVLGNEISEIEE